MPKLSPDRLQAHWAETFRLATGKRLASLDDAIQFVQERGFVYFWPIKGVTLPSLWAAVAGDRPVADAHDDPGHVTWGWKDGSLGKGVWYYAKILRKKATMIDLAVAPYFYALSENYGDPEEDVLIAYQEGRLTLEAKAIFEALLDNGPLDTIALRKNAHFASPDSNTRFERALAVLQADFKILPTGISDAGAWRYAFIYDLVHRHYPGLPQQAREIGERQARQKLAGLYVQSVGVAQMQEVVRLFGWRAKDAEHALDALVAAGQLRDDFELEDKPGKWYGLAALM